MIFYKKKKKKCDGILLQMDKRNYDGTKCDVCFSQVDTIYFQGLYQHIPSFLVILLGISKLFHDFF